MALVHRRSNIVQVFVPEQAWLDTPLQRTETYRAFHSVRPLNALGHQAELRGGFLMLRTPQYDLALRLHAHHRWFEYAMLNAVLP